VDRQEFGYGRGFFYLRAFLYVVLFAFAILFLALGTVTPPAWIAIVAALLVLYLLVVGLSPLLTKHVVLRSRLILRQGWYFRAVLPLEDIERIGPWDGEPRYGLKISTIRGILYVVGSGRNLVSARLREPRRFHQVLFLRAREVVFDVDDREAFLAAVEGRQTSAEALPAHKVLILPSARP